MERLLSDKVIDRVLYRSGLMVALKKTKAGEKRWMPLAFVPVSSGIVFASARFMAWLVVWWSGESGEMSLKT